MSDRAIPRSYRMMQGFGVHTVRLVNVKDEGRFVKFHWRPKQGTHSLLWDEAVRLNGVDADFHRRDLWEAIDSGAYPEWELGLQTFDEAQAAQWDFDALDATKLIPEELVAIDYVGRLVLDRNPDNFFVLRRDGAGGVPSRASRAGNRFLERSAAARANLLLHRYAVEPSRQPEFPRTANQPFACVCA